jgi:hypothetical protein
MRDGCWMLACWLGGGGRFPGSLALLASFDQNWRPLKLLGVLSFYQASFDFFLSFFYW